jgi:hypothetical protein
MDRTTAAAGQAARVYDKEAWEREGVLRPHPDGCGCGCDAETQRILDSIAADEVAAYEEHQARVVAEAGSQEPGAMLLPCGHRVDEHPDSTCDGLPPADPDGSELNEEVDPDLDSRARARSRARRRGDVGMEAWARRYDALNGAPESDEDR